MSVRRKLFVAFASFIVGMGLIFIFLTLTVVWGILHVMLDIDREEKIEQLTGYLLDYYQGNGHSWNRIGQFALPPSDETVYPGEEILLMSSDGRILYKSGDHHMELIRRFGIHSVIESDGNTAVHLYYYDREIGNMGKMRIGVTSSVTTLLILAALILMTIALFAAYRLARKITAPLSGLMAVIDRFGKANTAFKFRL